MNDSELALAVDCGQSGTRTVVVRGKHPGAVCHTPGLPDGSLLAVVDSLASSAQKLSNSEGPVRVIGCCSTGIELGNVRQMATVAAHLADRTGARTAVVTDDAVASHLGALSGRAGVVVAAGTGVCALALRDDGVFATADGWGYLIDDAGGGFWIGRRGLRAAVRYEDGRGGCRCLHDAASARYGVLGTAVFQLQVRHDSAAVIAAFATDIAEAARLGCEHSRRIWEEASRNLARTCAAAARAAARQPGRARWSMAGEGLTVSWAGSVFNAADLIVDPFTAAIAKELPGAIVTCPLGGALEGATRLIESNLSATPHAKLVARWDAST